MPALAAAGGLSQIAGILVWLVLIAGGLLLWRSWYERNHLVTEICELAADRLSPAWDGYTLAILADLHGNVLGEGHEDLLEAIDTQKPDAILIAGDMITERDGRMPDLESLWTLLEALTGKYPVYYADGNHEQRMDGRETFHRWLSEMGVVHLENASVCIEKRPEDGVLRITGLSLAEKYYKKKGRPLPLDEGYLQQTLGTVPEDAFQILLAHNPLYFADYAEWGADLSVSGHFHGGTVRLPWVGGVMTPQFQFFYPYTRGLYYRRRRDGKTAAMAVSAGLGTHSINVRLNNPAQLLLIRLTTNKE